MTEQTTRTRGEKKTATRRSSLSIPDTYGDVLYRRFDAEAPKKDDGRRMPFGEWLGALAVARLAEGDSPAARMSLTAGGAEVETAAAKGAALGVARSLEGFARDLGLVLSERLNEVDERLARMEAFMTGDAE